ncbi:cysteine desulfurase [Methanobacterium alcaliphilum]|uniref:cysteine desulfurase n=1 Tax=Methanobacterium alcaliphilum TaxID=392018 RepID=UPI00200A3046|nr:cysteine desulfurase [Methanobacterium alcaliphilum]MCK9151109.1 cysteine desulfurase [Methanobacterium alcaliphilum]
MESADVRSDIPILEEVIYLDAASTGPTPQPVVDAMCDYFYNYNTNTGRGAYSLAIKTTQKMQEARQKVAGFVNAPPEEIIFTKNTTEAINIVAHGLNWEKGDSILVPNIEHHSNFLPWLRLKEKGVNVKVIKADKNGIINPEQLVESIDDTTRLITITHVSNAFGSLQDIYEIGKIAEENESLYMIDAAQSVGHMETNVKKMKANFIAFPGHKGTLGPVGTGFLYCKYEDAEKLEVSDLGGGTVLDVDENNYQLESIPARFEGGTSNIAGYIGLGASVDYIQNIGLKKVEKHGLKLTKELYQGLSNVENVTCYGDPQNIYGIVSFNINNIHPHDVAKILDEVRKICVRSGHHCAIPSMKHMGVHELGGTVRASIHYYNTSEDIQALVETVEDIAKTFGV